MLLITQPKDFEMLNLILAEETKNNIMNDGHFHRLYYSDIYGTMKGLFIGFELHDVTIEKYFNKLKCNFIQNKNINIINFVKLVEKSVLNIILNKQNKTPVYRIEEQLQNDYIKIFYNNTQEIPENKTSVKLLLKISGIWTNDTEYGVTFRFFFIRQ